MKRFTCMFCLLFGLSMSITACGSDDTDTPDKQQPENTNPGNTQPENTKPENPENTKPENPENTKPENPGNTEPENPGNTEPENPGNTEPENPGNTEPENPGNTEPENPGNTAFDTENGKWRDDGYESGYHATINSASYTVNDKGTITEVEMLPKYASMSMGDLINEFCEHDFTTCGNVSHNYKSLAACKSDEKKASTAAARCSSAVRAYYILYTMMPCSTKCTESDFGTFSSLTACKAGDDALLSLLGMFMGCEN